MDIDINLVEKSCGSNNKGVPFPDIGNDPNFIFESDPLFSKVTLYDIDGNIINVNSWIECAHYVNGGWSSVVQTSFVGTIVLLQLTAVLYLGYGFFKYFNQRRLYD
tara:strand:+ start:239 stop:556 length:318 start_codon:yes stop_codon:yes gene_type:complete